MRISFLTYIFLCILISSCITPKDACELKRTTKEWSNSQIALSAWTDTPFSGIFLTLRDNGKFEYPSSGFFRSFEAGNWTNLKDTIRLEYFNSKHTIIRNQNIVIDRQTSTLIIEGDSTPVQMRLRIMINKIE